MRLVAVFVVSFLSAAAPVAAQVLNDGDRIQRNDTLTDRDAAAAAVDIMSRTLPFKHGQTLRYYNEKGELQGYAQRTRLTIRFYDPDGALVGRAVRISQGATAYYDADGRYLGRRYHKKQTTRSRVTTVNSGAKGFRESTRPVGQPGDD